MRGDDFARLTRVDGVIHMRDRFRPGQDRSGRRSGWWTLCRTIPHPSQDPGESVLNPPRRDSRYDDLIGPGKRFEFIDGDTVRRDDDYCDRCFPEGLAPVLSWQRHRKRARWLSRGAVAVIVAGLAYGCVAISRDDGSSDTQNEAGSLPAQFTTEDSQDTCGYLHYLGSTAVELDISTGANALGVALALDRTRPPQAVRSTEQLRRFFTDYRREVENEVDYWAGLQAERPDLTPIVEGFGTKWAEWACADVPEVNELPVTDGGVPHQGSLAVDLADE